MDKSGKYYIVKERALPEVLLKVVEAKRLIDSEKAMTVQEATDATGISRSSFYASSGKNRMPACRFGEHCDNSRNSQSVFLELVRLLINIACLKF